MGVPSVVVHWLKSPVSKPSVNRVAENTGRINIVEDIRTKRRKIEVKFFVVEFFLCIVF